MALRWEDTPYVRLYRTPMFGPWRELSLGARGLFDELLLVVDRAGFLALGRNTVRSVSMAVAGDPSEVDKCLQELLDDGCIVLVEQDKGKALLIKNFVEAQCARTGDRVRQAESRRRARDQGLKNASKQQSRQLSLHQRDTRSRDPDSCDVLSRKRSDSDKNVTLSLTELSLAQIPPNPPEGGTSMASEEGEAMPFAPGSPEWDDAVSRIGRRHGDGQ